jgi:AcrR family transcriptional regulator
MALTYCSPVKPRDTPRTPSRDAAEQTGGGGRPLRRDAARNRERLLETAAELFTAEGLEAGVDDIARLAGVGMGTLYRRFPTKAALVEELVLEVLSDLLRDAQEALHEPHGRGLETFLYALGTRQSSPVGFLPRLWTTPQHAELMSAIQATTAQLVSDAQRQDQVRADVTPADIFSIMWSLRGVIEATRGVTPDAWRRHLDIILAGLRPSDTPLPDGPMPDAILDDVLARVTGQGHPGS